MHADLERVIALQHLDTAAAEARRKLAEGPERDKTFDTRLADAKQRVDDAKAKLAANSDARRTIEKEVAVHQGRLSKYRDQAMAVKTNQEYHAIQHEMAHAQGEIKKHEDAILERMLEADELTATIKAAEADLAAQQKAIDAERVKMKAEDAERHKVLEQLVADRIALVAQIDKQVLATYERVAANRHGIAVADAHDGICSVCHVRLRPQVANIVRRNDSIVQCDSCQRILYAQLPGAATTHAS
jgi:predicted  nucleic acid-binding Zn-ribbon protein